MEKKAHQKHIKLNRPDLGQWGRCEFAILGTVCDDINSFTHQLKNSLRDKYAIAYIDASHSKQSNYSQFSIDATQHSDHWEIRTDKVTNMYQSRLRYYDTDIQFVNGNHFTASQQIIILDDRKKESLERKTDRLTDLRCIIKKYKDQQIYSFLTPFMSDNTVVLLEENTEELCDYILQIKLASEKMNGLILAGGKSSRMGSDKAKINYHGQEQVEYVYDKLKPKCSEVFVSVRSVQASEYSIPVIEDSFHDFGPLGGILSAFKHNPNSAWITIATDLPFVSDSSIEELISNRDKSKIATCFITSNNEFPDPLFTIWEPKAYQSLLTFLALGYSCPRKVLINSDVKVIPISDDRILMNVNNPEDLEKAKQLLKQ